MELSNEGSPENYGYILNMIQQLSQRVDFLETENNCLKDQIKRIFDSNEKNVGKNTPQKMISILEEQPSPSISFNNWIEHTLSLVKENLEIVFKNDLLTGINSALTDSINSYTYLPIAVFERKPNIFYYYNEEEQWTVLELSDLNKFIGRIAYRFLVEFNINWYQPNVKNIKESEEYQSMYNSYYLSILGGHRLTDETRNQRVKNAIYLSLKQPISK